MRRGDKSWGGVEVREKAAGFKGVLQNYTVVGSSEQGGCGGWWRKDTYFS